MSYPHQQEINAGQFFQQTSVKLREQLSQVKQFQIGMEAAQNLLAREIQNEKYIIMLINTVRSSHQGDEDMIRFRANLGIREQGSTA